MILEWPESSLIAGSEYDVDKCELTIHFKKYYIEQETYYVEPETYIAFCKAKSKGKFYLNFIKPKKTKQMADLIIKCKIDVTKLLKEWLFSGTKGTYLNCTVLYNAEKDAYGNNGMITQDVPTEVYKKDKAKRGPILGNCKVFEKGVDNIEQQPGQEKGLTLVGDATSPEAKAAWDDLPF